MTGRTRCRSWSYKRILAGAYSAVMIMIIRLRKDNCGGDDWFNEGAAFSVSPLRTSFLSSVLGVVRVYCGALGRKGLHLLAHLAAIDRQLDQQVDYVASDPV
jgi:hypothetical protein